MYGKRTVSIAGGLALIWASGASGFRTCETQGSDAWSASTRYTVGELTFDDATGYASGTETFYNYSNSYAAGPGECHVTYELSGSYVPGVEVFVLNATRTNYSDSCPHSLLRIEYPETLSHSFQMAYADDGSAVVNSADSGELVAGGSWQPGRAVFKTGEQCSIF
ncbi:MAG: hypothetical protein V2I26_01560 [Halieaceae bacterium]|jgi:hypothetical protein|nr:hypothetical protein [Halieaceae bacterium]